MDRRRRVELERRLADAASLPEWRAAAEELDELDERAVWRADDDSPSFDARLLRRHIAELDQLTARRELGALEVVLTESLYRNLNEVTAPHLYAHTHTGETKHVVTDWIDACVRAMHTLRDTEIPGLDRAAKLRRFQRAYDNLGQTALMLSGGGAWGLYHLGVVRALRDQALLPSVICGSSMGAIIASGVCVRRDADLDAMYDDPQTIHRVAVRLSSPVRAVRDRAALSIDQLREHVETNVGGDTFREAFERTGRVLNVSVSPTRARQKPRVLSHLTAPDVLVADATVASCAIPGLFPPVALRQRLPNGQTAPYAETERWVDGSLRGDLPLRQMGRVHNVNHFVVSQANPFVLPFVARHKQDPATRAARFVGSLARAQTAAVLDEARRHVVSDRVRPWLDAAHALTAQHYGGDIDIHPRVPPAQYLRVMSNPSMAQLQDYILGGERAAWPRLAAVRDQTRITRELAEIVRSLATAG